MKILVTGGTGVIGEGLIPELLARGHAVRLLSRSAAEDVKQWKGVEPFAGDIGDAASIAGAAHGCGAVLHVAGIVSENPPETTFAGVNVNGTRNVLAEASRSSVSRFVYVSSLGADTGSSDYHQSKRQAEQLVEASGLAWTIVRPGNVYGPGDDVISTILKMVRVLPALPVISDGEQKFQPIWYEDLAKVLALSVEKDGLENQILEAAGPDITTMKDLLHRFGTITGREPIKVPIPLPLAALVARLVNTSASIPLDENKLTMLREENVVRGSNVMTTFGIAGTPLDVGLRLLADSQNEVLPEDGVGSLQHKRYWADINDSPHTAVSLMQTFCNHVNEFMAVEFAAEPGAPEKLEQGATFTGALPLRGNFQVRVEVMEPQRVVLATIEGHPLAGIVEITTSESSMAVRFAIDVFARAANFIDWIATRTIGGPAQDANWRTVVQRVIDRSGGSADEIFEEKTTLEGQDAAAVETRVREMVQARKRDEVHV